MKRAGELWSHLGASDNIIGRAGRTLLYLIFGVLAYQCVTLRFDWKQQAIVGFLTLTIGLTLYTFSQAYVSTLMLIVASVLTTCRYAIWRVTQVYKAVIDPSSNLRWIELFFMFLLLAAEMYAFAILLLGFIQMIYPLRRPPAALPENVEEWPDVDLLIPTYNEPLSVVRSTALASINIDYPSDKLHVFLLDDGRRQEFREFCDQVGIGYVIRPDNNHAKAGNINSALKNMKSPLVAIFDCDHVPTRSFLQVTAGWFLRDKKLGMLQTPHHFYSPDPFERNLGSYRTVPNEGELFYGLLQDGNDLWNATFFCGSCAVLRRTALNEIGGIAVETVTEDAHTSLRMQMRGWNTAYINRPQAAGLATESLSAHVGQRIRWARGMIQILRVDNPLFARGLKLSQRLCYFNAMVHFLYALPRLIFLTAPLIYMLFGLRNIPGLWITIGVYALPHLVLSTITNSRLQGRYRYSFWNEIYETVLAPYILGPTLLALINPKLGKFNVTAKGGVVAKSYFDKSIARPYLYLLLLNYAGLAIAPWRFFVWNADHKGAVLMNVFWIVFNCVILGTANAVAVEAQQRRGTVRLNRRMIVSIRTLSGATVSGLSSDLSMGGGAIQLEQSAELDHGALIDVIFTGGVPLVIPAKVVRSNGTTLHFQYRQLTLEQEESLTLVLYARADSWLTQEHAPDRPLKSLSSIIRLSLRGIRYSFTSLLPSGQSKTISREAEISATLLLCILLLIPGMLRGEATAPRPSPHNFRSVISLTDTGLKNGMVLHGADTSSSTSFVLGSSQIAQNGILHLSYQFSPQMVAGRSFLTVSFNNTALQDLVMPAEATKEDAPVFHADIPIPAELLSTQNTLEIHLRGHYLAKCEDPMDQRLWAKVAPLSTLEVAGSLLPMANDLGALPAPFFEKDQTISLTPIRFAFASTPSPTVLQAAGVLSSWFGVQANSHHLSFPVSIGSIPQGNTVLIALNNSPMLAILNQHFQGPHLTMLQNPSDQLSRILIVSADTEEQLLGLTRTVAVGRKFTGDAAAVDLASLPAPRRIGDAPRWVQTSTPSSLWSYTQTEELSTNGSQPIASYVRIPPDLYFGDQDSINLRLQYATSHRSASQPAYLRVVANGSQVTYLPISQDGGLNQPQNIQIPIPVSSLRPFANTLLFEFIFPRDSHQSPCATITPTNITGTVYPSSNLDLHQFPHWTGMPNLELFANAGFPFTRFADLSHTTVILPQQPSAREITEMLDLLAYFGAQTGYPGFRLQVGDNSSFDQDSDLLIIGTESDIPSNHSLLAALPVSIQEGVLTHRVDTTFSLLKSLWTRISRFDPDSFSDIRGVEEETRLDRSLNDSFDSVLQMAKSPARNNRSIIMLVLGSGEQDPFPAFLDVSSSKNINGNLSIQHGKEFESFSLDPSPYYVGHISALGQLRARMHQAPWLGVLFPFVVGLLCAPWVHTRLKNRAQKRLEGDFA
ncbi:UDP-forming cellulose synthase catalytic subunit [Edaphobacter sp. HDX4]|uniref:UDP-forming cellulose synthase catalytic subunit n=1 Tax=Edaphobacter sp. HDX4 TaxID=2794064 RepID=UPI002FE6B0B3